VGGVLLLGDVRELRLERVLRERHVHGLALLDPNFWVKGPRRLPHSLARRTL
jgi:hypothetical protein